MDFSEIDNAIEKFYSGICEEAAPFLESIQKSINAWNISFQLLARNKNLQSTFFAVKTLRQKVLSSLAELPEEQHGGFIQALLDQIVYFSEESTSQVVTQLCLVFLDSTFLLALWDDNFLSNMINFFEGRGLVKTLLKMLSLLPEEMESLRLGRNRRCDLKNNLINSIPQVVNFIERSSEKQRHVDEILKCLTEWVSSDLLTWRDLAGHNEIVKELFSILNSPQLYLQKLAADVLSSLFMKCKEKFTSELLDSYGIWFMLMREVQVSPEKPEATRKIWSVLSALCELFVTKIAMASNEDLIMYFPHIASFLDSILNHAHHRYIIQSTFKMWSNIAKELQDKDDNIITMFRPYFSKMILSLCEHCKMEENDEGLLDDEELEDFREDAFRLLEDIEMITGGHNLFKELLQVLMSPRSTWNESELIFVILESIIPHLRCCNETDELFLQLFEAIPHKFNEHIALNYSIIRMFPELTEFLNRHPNILCEVLNYIGQCLLQPDLVSVSSRIFRRICESCYMHITEYIAVCMEMVRYFENDDRITPRALENLVVGTSIILAHIDIKESRQMIGDICSMQTFPLSFVMENPNPYLDRLYKILKEFNFGNGADSSHDILGQIWPIIIGCLKTYSPNERITERCCRVLRELTRHYSMSHRYDGLVELLNIIPEFFLKYEHSCLLYLASILMNEYGDNPNLSATFSNFAHILIDHTFQILTDVNALEVHGYLVDDLYRLCRKFMTKMPTSFLNSPLTEKILNCASVSASLDQHSFSYSVTQFLKEFVCLYEKLPFSSTPEEVIIWSRHFNHIAPSVVKYSLEAVTKNYRSEDYLDVVPILKELIGRCYDQTVFWIQNGLNELCIDSDIGLQFISSISKSVNDMKPAIKELRKMVFQF